MLVRLTQKGNRLFRGGPHSNILSPRCLREAGKAPPQPAVCEFTPVPACPKGEKGRVPGIRNGIHQRKVSISRIAAGPPTIKNMVGMMKSITGTVSMAGRRFARSSSSII